MGYQYVLEGLAQGSAPAPETPLPFDVLVLCAREYQPKPASLYYPRKTVLYAPLDDSGRPPTRDEIGIAATTSRAALRAYQHGKRVLVTCWMGRNRSGLVTGLILMQLGYSSLEAITLVRCAREGALSNPFFREVLHGCDSKQAHRAQAL